jgi:chromosome segregation ATPase
MNDKLRINVIFALILILSGLTLSGCLEDPEERAARQTRIANARALAMLRAGDDADAVRKELQKALVGRDQQTAALIGAHLSFDEAVQSQAQLTAIRLKIPDLLETISSASADIRESELEQYRLQKLLAAGDKQINQLKDMLEGTAGQEQGLRAQLQDLHKQSDELLEKKELLNSQLDQARKQAVELQRRADNLLRMAEQADKEEEALLQQQAFELLKGKGEASQGKTDWLAKAQEVMDKISDVESRLALIIPRIEKLTEDIAYAQKRIEDIEDSKNRSQMRICLRDVQSRIDDGSRQIRKHLGQLAALESNYGQVVDKVVDLFGKAGKEYEKASSSADKQLANIASMAAADCFFRIGRAYAEYTKLQSRLAQQLELLTTSAQIDVAGALGNAARNYAGGTEKYSNKAVENYDQAVKIYEKLHKRAGRKKDDFTRSAITNYILVLYAKARLAEYIGKVDWQSQAVEQAQKLAEQATEYDPDFEQSITGSLLQDLK